VDRAAGELEARYRAAIAQRGFRVDPQQRAALAHLEDLRDRLVAANRREGSWGTRLSRVIGRAPRQAERGVYLWGGVGRGKTFLLDLFHESLPFEARRRAHFHRFMHDVHAALAAAPHVADPLEQVADRIVGARLRVLCFDELFVSDIADAMILGGLFEALTGRGVTLVFTSNVPPSGLYREGLQRQRFLPAVAHLEHWTRVVHVDGDEDHRLRQLAGARLYVDAAAPDAVAALEGLFHRLADGPGTGPVELRISGRPIAARRDSDLAVWLTFDALCRGPRGTDDYIELARDYRAVVLEGVPVFDQTLENEARRFVALVDELYDRGVKLALSAAAPPTGLYRGRRLAFEFERTASRLVEMQGTAYLARPHLG
jgi:cell division protein ZapE